MIIAPNGDRFDVIREQIEVTSLHRPDTSWGVTDDAGHQHRWHLGDLPAIGYLPAAAYTLPTLEHVFDYWEYHEDGARTSVGHYECRICRAHVEPGYTADTTRQYIAGLAHYYVNGDRVSREEFEQKVRAAGLPL